MSDTSSMAEGTGASYPARLDIDYPEAGLSRVKTLFRIILIIPIVIVLLLVSSSSSGWGSGDWESLYALFGALFLPTLLMLLFRRKYPRWWFDWNLELTRFVTRITAYMGLLREEYPSTDEQQAVHLDLDYPDASRDLKRWMPLVKWFLAIPHLILLFFLYIAAFLSVVFAWFAIMFTGRYPRGLFDFVVGVERWQLRVNAYAFLLITDRYPPFSLQ
ncbi:DUF4389 domain-containing protein [Candidatus Poriferisocius sp.]|uniref:DUF4389 domain-containing protein n=1 Tax=Candidatus Poriferisocius sp. TaxID=3101276 RepID=UPI003B5A1A99